MLVLGVALRKESVDRNGLLPKNTTGTPSSLSARRAWIEISILRGEGLIPPSLSARRAWIEITKCGAKLYRGRCRSPQGERG